MRWWDGEAWTEHRHPDPAGGRDPRAEPRVPVGPTKVSGWAIASVVIGVLGGALIAIVCGMIARDRIRASGGRLTGEALANAGIVLGSIGAIAVGAYLYGGFGKHDNAGGYSGEDKKIAKVVDQLQSALGKHDGDKACDELLTTSFATKVARGSGQSCSDFVHGAIESGQFQSRLDVRSITSDPTTATLKVHEGSDKEIWTMRLEQGTWRVDSIAPDPAA